MSARTLAVVLAYAVVVAFGLGLIVVLGAQSPVTVVTDPAAQAPSWCGQITQAPAPWRP